VATGTSASSPCVSARNPRFGLVCTSPFSRAQNEKKRDCAEKQVECDSHPSPPSGDSDPADCKEQLDCQTGIPKSGCTVGRLQVSCCQLLSIYGKKCPVPDKRRNSTQIRTPERVTSLSVYLMIKPIGSANITSTMIRLDKASNQSLNQVTWQCAPDN
jgi:hypothetical protein